MRGKGLLRAMASAGLAMTGVFRRTETSLHRGDDELVMPAVPRSVSVPGGTYYGDRGNVGVRARRKRRKAQRLARRMNRR